LLICRKIAVLKFIVFAFQPRHHARSVTVFSNAKGQETARAERGRDGTLQFYNEKGRGVGSARTR
jgi:hypothetical protein